MTSPLWIQNLFDVASNTGLQYPTLAAYRAAPVPPDGSPITITNPAMLLVYAANQGAGTPDDGVKYIRQTANPTGNGIAINTSTAINVAASKVLRQNDAGTIVVASDIEKNWTDAPYNADNTGATDATSAINAALAAGVTHGGPPGSVYAISGSLIVHNNQHIHLRGVTISAACTTAAISLTSLYDAIVEGGTINNTMGPAVGMYYGCTRCYLIGMRSRAYLGNGLDIYNGLAAGFQNHYEIYFDQGSQSRTRLDGQTAISIVGYELYSSILTSWNYVGNGIRIADIPGGGGHVTLGLRFKCLLANGVINSTYSAKAVESLVGNDNIFEFSSEQTGNPSTNSVDCLYMTDPANANACDSNQILGTFDGVIPLTVGASIPASPHLCYVHVGADGRVAGRQTTFGVSDSQSDSHHRL